MSAEANVETVKLMYDAFTKGDVATILDQCTDDVDWASDAWVTPPRGGASTRARRP